MTVEELIKLLETYEPDVIVKVIVDTEIGYEYSYPYVTNIWGPPEPELIGKELCL